MIEVRRTDYEQAARYYCAHPFGDTKAAELEKLLKRAQDEDVDALSYLFAAHRKQAEDAMKERCAVIADQHRAGRLLAKDDAAKRKACSEARDHESMAIEAMHIATAIRNTDAGGEGK